MVQVLSVIYIVPCAVGVCVLLGNCLQIFGVRRRINDIHRLIVNCIFIDLSLLLVTHCPGANIVLCRISHDASYCIIIGNETREIGF